MLTIGQLADAADVTTATLRYYDEVGLVAPAERTAAGYRQYTTGAIDRLAFIRRAKELGCTIPDIRQLLVAWDGGRCGPLQDELRALVAANIAQAHVRLADVHDAIRDLERAARALEQHRPDGPCDDRCGCGSTPAEAVPAATLIELGTKVPAGCSLQPAELPERLTEWQAALAAVVSHEPLPDGLHLRFAPHADVAGLAKLIVAEQGCCTFFRFALTADERGVGLDVRAPAEQQALVWALFGSSTAVN